MNHFLTIIDKNVEPFRGCLVLGDIHNEFQSLEKASHYAFENDLYIVTLGDLVDYGSDAYRTIELINDLMASKRLSSVIGNHDYKINRLYDQKDRGAITITVKPCMEGTIAQLSQNGGEQLFRTVYQQMSFVLRFKNMFMTHGAIHHSIQRDDFCFEELDKSKKERLVSLCLFGEINRLEPSKPDGYPNRSYGWVDRIVSPYSVIVGHDIRGYEPVFDNRVCFTDCGCGKGGKLFGMHLDSQGNAVGYVEF